MSQLPRAAATQAVCSALVVAVTAGFVSVSGTWLGRWVYGVKFGLFVNASYIGSAVMSSWFIGGRLDPVTAESIDVVGEALADLEG